MTLLILHTCDVSLGLLKLPAPNAGDVVEVFLLYFIVKISLYAVFTALY
jgi:hypothetical protein